MKKFMAIVMVMFLLGTLVACSSKWKTDNDFAYIEITTSIGTAHVATAFHGNNHVADMNRAENATSAQNIVKGDLADGETANIHFHCDQCGYDETIEEAVAPYARMFACECPNTPEDGIMKEYIAVEIGVNADFANVDAESTK